MSAQFGDGRLPAHFWAKVQPVDTGCWIWVAAVTSRGYGSWGVNGKARSTHRVSYEALVGPIPEGLTIDHLCRVKRCCNVDHLEPVTGAENLRRYARTITHCAQGHPLDGINLRIHGTRKTRVCIACQREANRLYRLRVREQVAA